MNKKTLNKKGYFKLLKITFLSIFIFFIALGIIAILIEDDKPLIGFFWAAIVAIVYWLIKKIFWNQK